MRENNDNKIKKTLEINLIKNDKKPVFFDLTEKVS